MPRAFVVLSLGLLFLAPTHAHAYCLDKYPGQTEYAKMAKVPVKYRVSNTLKDPKLLAAVDAAFNTWGSVSCSTLTFQKDAQFDPAKVGFKASGTGYINVFWVATAAHIPRPLFF